MQTKIRPCRGEFFLRSTPKTLPMETIKKIAKHIQSIPKSLPKALPKHYQTTPNGNNKKNPKHIQSIPKALPKALPKHYQTTPKQGRIARKEVCLIHTGPIPINVQDGINVQGGIFSQN